VTSAISQTAWPQVQPLFHAAHEASGVERERLLADDAYDPAVRAYVARLIRAADREGDALETPAITAIRDRCASV
jgi:hypothetical protein